MARTSSTSKRPALPPRRPPPRPPAAEYADPKSLKPWPLNPRLRPSQAVVLELAASIKALGWGAPILARRKDRLIVAGHTRQLAALHLGLATVPVRFLELTDEQAATMAMADNRLAERGKWDPDRRAAVLRGLPSAAAALAGFNPKDLEEALGAAPKLEGPAAPARNRTPYTIKLDQEERVAFVQALEAARRERPKLRAGELVAEWARTRGTTS